jgi:hypothetical protein
MLLLPSVVIDGSTTIIARPRSQIEVLATCDSRFAEHRCFWARRCWSALHHCEPQWKVVRWSQASVLME